MTRSRREVEYQEHEISGLVVYQMGSISIRLLLTFVAVVLYLTPKRHYFSSALFFLYVLPKLFFTAHRCEAVLSGTYQSR